MFWSCYKDNMFSSAVRIQLLLRFLLILILLSSSWVFAQSGTLFIEQNSVKLSLDPFVKILFDSDHHLLIDDIKALPDDRFQPLSKDGNSIGFTDASIWLRFKLHVAPTVTSSLIFTLDAPLVDFVSFYSPNKNNEYIKQTTGDKIPYSEHLVDYRNPIFFIHPEKGKTVEYFVQVNSEGPIQLPLKLWSEDQFIGAHDKVQLFFGMYYGFMIILIVAALYAAIMLRDQLFFRYSVYLLTFLLFQMSLNGVSFQYLWGEYPQYASQFNSSLVGLVVVATLWFSSYFLKVKAFAPRMYKVFVVLQFVAFTSVILIWTDLFRFATQLAAMSGIAVAPLFSITVFKILKRGYKPARYFSAAWFVLMVGVIASGLAFLGYIPINFFTLYAMQIGSTFEIIILMFALFERYKVLADEKIDAEKTARYVISQLNEKLETLVDERTKELKSSNEKLRELASQDSLTGLLNHNASINQLEKAIDGALRYNYAIAVIMVDIDYFKVLNDNYGHLAGDDILVSISDVLKTNLRNTDSCGRYGGEEFLLILTHTELAEAKVLAERIKVAITKIYSDRAPGAKVTASFGIAMCYPKQCKQSNADALIALADKALYKAKDEGRNRICVSPTIQLSA